MEYETSKGANSQFISALVGLPWNRIHEDSGKNNLKKNLSPRASYSFYAPYPGDEEPRDS